MENNSLAHDAIFRALADPTRRAVVQRLGQGDATVSALAAPFEMGLPSFLKHLSILEDAGLVDTSKAGRVRTCSLRTDRLAEAERWFVRQRAIWESRHDNLDHLLTQLAGDRIHDT